MQDHIWDSDRHAINALHQEARLWWAAHCLYLAPEARATFVKVVNSIMLHKAFRDGGVVDLVEERKSFEALGDVLAGAVELPELENIQLLPTQI